MSHINPGWQKKKLGDVCELIKRGVAPKYLDDGGICVLNQKCIRDHRINYSLARRHNLEEKNIPQDRYIQTGDVLINSTGTGTLGRVAQVRVKPEEPTTTDTHVTIVRPKPGLFFDDFLGYMLIDIEDKIASSGEGTSGQTELPRKKIEQEFYVQYPDSIPEQKRIVAILDATFERIDAAIANTEKNLANARELFESYLNDVFEKKGEGWTDCKLEEVLEIQPRNGWSPPARHHSDAGIPVLTLSSVTGFEFKENQVKFTSAPTDASAHYWVHDGDLLITRSNTTELVGHVAICSGISEPTVYPDLIMRMRVDARNALTQFIYYQLRSDKIRNIIRTNATGANPTMKKIKKATVQDLPITCPPLEQQAKIVDSLTALSSQVQSLKRIYSDKLTALTELKQSILQKAFSGQITADTNLEDPTDSAPNHSTQLNIRELARD